MRLGDAVAGLLILACGIAIALYARTFPAIPGQQIGPAFFPVMIGAGLAILGAVLASGGRRGPDRGLRADDWTRHPVLLARFVLVIAALLFYALAVDRLGFFATAFLLLTTLMLAFGVRRRWIVPAAALVTLAIHYAFYTLLRVPLPWGVLEPLAW